MDEVQIYLSKVVQTIISVSKNISQWNKEKQRVSNYHRMNSDWKFYVELKGFLRYLSPPLLKLFICCSLIL